MKKKKILKSMLVAGMAALALVGSSLVINQREVSAASVSNVNLISNDWYKSGDEWYWKNSDGTYANGWKNIGGKYYYFMSGKFSGKTYYGEMAKDTIITLDSYKTFYAFAPDGAMYSGGWSKVQGCWVYATSSGSLKTGWQKIDNKWYYFDKYDFAVMSVGRDYIDGKYYFFDKSGAMAKSGWCTDGDYWYYANSDGTLKEGWQKIDNKWYYFSYGRMQTGRCLIDGDYYYFNDSGVMQKGWVKNKYGSWYCAGTDGKLKSGWQMLGGVWYHFGSSNTMDTGKCVIGSSAYYFDKTSGAMQTGWISPFSGSWYYADSNGCLFKDGDKTIGGKLYHFTNYYLD